MRLSIARLSALSFQLGSITFSIGCGIFDVTFIALPSKIYVSSFKGMLPCIVELKYNVFAAQAPAIDRASFPFLNYEVDSGTCKIMHKSIVFLL